MLKSKISNPEKTQRKCRPKRRPKGCLEKTNKRKAIKEIHVYAPKPKKIKLKKMNKTTYLVYTNLFYL